jgi:glucose uptake protein
MYQPEAYGIALFFMIASMLCWGSWANTMKLTPGWPFQLFYWDYVIGIIAASLLWGLTLGSAGGGELSFLRNIGSADATHVIFALFGGAVFNVANLLLVAAIDIAGLAVAFADRHWVSPRSGSPTELLHFPSRQSPFAVWWCATGRPRYRRGRDGLS